MREQLASSPDFVTTEELLTEDRSEACRAAVRAFRPGRVPAALVAAFLLTALGAVAAVLVTSTLLGRPVIRPMVIAWAGGLIHTLRWSDPLTLAVTGGVAFAGLLLVLSALLPGRARTTALAGDDPRFIAGITRPGLRTALRAAASQVSGIDRARVRLRGRLRPRVAVYAVTGFRNPANFGEQVADAVRARLARIDPVRIPRVTVRLTWRKD